MSSVIRSRSSISIRERRIRIRKRRRVEKCQVVGADGKRREKQLRINCLNSSGVLVVVLLLVARVTKSDSCVNETSDSCLPACQEGIGIESSLEATSRSETDELRAALSRYYKFPYGSGVRLSSKKSNDSAKNLSPADQTKEQPQPQQQQQQQLDELPRPSNVSVLVISWYPPVLRLSWDLHELSEHRAKELDFYGSNLKEQKVNVSSLLEEIDLALLASSSAHQEGVDTFNDDAEDEGEGESANEVGIQNGSGEKSLNSEGRIRRLLVRKALTCFQVTYNIINSRFKVTEEYPPYLRSILLERLLPATEYSLQVAAVYLNRHRLVSERVQFVSPTDNESRRFKENTYRPIHHYPDIEPRNVRYGLGQVRSEELTIVAIALLFWVATICLFFNKWGKIRMLEPYQPAYREAESPAPFAAHHHPSLLNLANSAVGSAGTGGSGHALTSTQVVAAAAKLGATPEGTRNSGTGIGELVSGDLAVVSGTQQANQSLKACRHSDGALSSLPQGVAPLLPAPAPTLTAKSHTPQVAPVSSSHRAALVKRFESVTSQDSLINARRTDAELNYLFQSKAHVLAKATSLWSRQQQQKLRQQQYRTAQQHVELEMLRRTSQALLLNQRQRQMSTCSPLGTTVPTIATVSAVPIAPSHVSCSSAQGASFERPLVSASQVVNAQQLQQRTVSAQLRHSPDAHQERSRSMEQSVTEEATGNKLRRLLFMSKSNQHQHIATSTSSSTLINLQQQQTQQQHQQQQQYQQQERQQQIHSIYSSGKQVNSVSLDAAPISTPGLSTPDAQSPSGKFRQASTESAPPATLFGFPRMRGRSSTVGRTVAPSTEPHHILIEPPSPPNPRELLSTPICYSPTTSDGSSTSPNPNPNQSPAVQLLAPAELQANSAAHSESGADEPNKTSKGSSCSDKEQFERQRLACQDYPLDNKQQERHLRETEMPASDSCSTRLFPRSTESPPTAGQQHDHDNHHVQRASNQQQEGAFLTSNSSSASLRNLNAIGGEMSERASGYAFELQQQQQRRASSFTGAANNGAAATRLESSIQQPDRHSATSRPVSGAADGRDAFARLVRSRTRQNATERLDGSRSALQLSNPTSYRQSLVSSGFVDSPDCPSRRHQSFCGGGSGGGDDGVSFGLNSEYAYSTTALPPPSLPQETSQQCLQCALIERLASGSSSNDTRAHLCWNHLHQRPSCTSQTSQNSTCALHIEQAGSGTELSGEEDPTRPRLSSVFASSSYSRAHRGSFAMLRALSQKKSKSAEDVAYLSSLVLQIWVRERNPLLQSVSQQQLQQQREQQQQQLSRRHRPKSSLTVAHI